MLDTGNSEPTKIGALITRYQDIYSLPSGMLGESFQHDGMHAMTGLDASGRSELCIKVLQKGLTEGPSGESFCAGVHEIVLHEGLRAFYRNERRNMNAQSSRLAFEESCCIQSDLPHLAKGEIAEMHALAKKIDRTVRQVTGKPYRRLTNDEVAALDFNKVDFISETTAILRKYDTPQTRRIAEELAGVFQGSAKEKGQRFLPPAAGVPWHHAARATAGKQQPAPRGLRGLLSRVTSLSA
jgi:hypothetical protein